MHQAGSLVRGISAEMQDEILAILIFDKSFFDNTKDIINERFFSGDNYKTLYNAAKQFYTVHSTTPSLKDMMIEVSLLVASDREKIFSIKAILKNLYSDYLEEYIDKDDEVKRSHFEEFIRRNGAEYCFSSVIESSRNDDGIDWDKVIPEFQKYTEFSIISNEVYNMGDFDKVAQIHEDAVGNSNSTHKIRFFIDEINTLMNNDAICPGTLNMISASPGVGKTLTLINQGVQACKDGFTNLHIFLGDVNTDGGRLRYLACFSQMKLSSLNKMTIDEQIELSKRINEAEETKGALSRNYVLELPAGTINVQSLCNLIEKNQLKAGVHFDQIIVDYDANIKNNKESMYDGGGEIYNYLREFGKKNKSVMFVASQPKIAFFNQEILTLDAASESSQKQHIIDLMITLGRPGKIDVPIATLFVPKNRDGRCNKKIYLQRDGARQTVYPISKEEYDRIKLEGEQQ